MTHLLLHKTPNSVSSEPGAAHRAPADAREIMLDFVVFHGSLLGNDFSKQQTKLRNIPLTVSEVIQEFALSVVGIDFECQIERSARSNDTKILIEHNERFSNRVDDSVRKYPGILDLGELFSEHVSEHSGHPRRGGSQPNSQSAARPSAAEDSSTVHPRCAVGMWCVINFRFGARVPQSYKLAEAREFDSPNITQPAHSGGFL